MGERRSADRRLVRKLERGRLLERPRQYGRIILKLNLEK
jgi:hypothetical protein